MSDTKRIVIVEDVDSVRRTLEILMESCGFSVQSYASAEAALEDHEDLQSSACLVLDFQLQELNGLQLLEQLKNRSIMVPTIIVSGSISAHNQEQLHAAGVEMVLSKPVRGRKLVDAIREIVGAP